MDQTQLHLALYFIFYRLHICTKPIRLPAVSADRGDALWTSPRSLHAPLSSTEATPKALNLKWFIKGVYVGVRVSLVCVGTPSELQHLFPQHEANISSTHSLRQDPDTIASSRVLHCSASSLFTHYPSSPHHTTAHLQDKAHSWPPHLCPTPQADLSSTL